MAYFIVATVKVLTFLIGITEGLEFKSEGKLPEVSLIANFLQSLIGPYVKSLQESNTRNVFFRTSEETLVEKVIRKKVEELKPLLQDNDINDSVNDDEALEGKDETTIIEFISDDKNKNKGNLRVEGSNTESLKTNLRKYKKMRNEIKIALINESVSDKTQNLITTTFDELLAQIIGNQCLWKSMAPNRRNFDGKVQKSLTITDNWTQKWFGVKEQYYKLLKDQPLDLNHEKKLIHFFDQIHEFIQHIVKDTAELMKDNKIICQFVNRTRIIPEKFSNVHMDTLTKDRNKNTHKHLCPIFKVCSTELKIFMTNLYSNLNDTTVSTIRNYATMYKSDVTDTSDEKGTVLTILRQIGKDTQKKVSKIFRKETIKFMLDENKKSDENQIILKHYIRNTIERCKQLLKKNLERQLKSLRATLYLSIQQDVSVNLDVDLENLERDLKESVCRVFSSCNGHLTRRYDYGFDESTHSIGNRNVYVNVKITLDDEIKDEIVNSGGSIMRFLRNSTERKRYVTYTGNTKLTRTTYKKYESNTPTLESQKFTVV